ncbi:MAG: MCE family protein [Actinomycetota bacterium]
MRRRLGVAAFAALLMVGGGATYVSLQAADTYTITADVTQAPNLFEGARVMVRGVDVGVISGVEPRAGAVRITMDIRDGVRVPADATLAVVPITVIADRYVQLAPPYDSGPTLADGDHIPVTRTSIPAELDDVLEQLEGLFAALEPPSGERGPLARLIENLDAALDDASEELAGSLEGSAAVLGNLASSEAEISGLIRNLDRLFVALANRSSQIGLVNQRLELVAEALAASRDDLEGTLENVAFLSDQAARLVSESGESLGRSFGRLKRVLREVLAHQGSLSEGMRWTNVIARGLGATDARGRGLFAYSGRRATPGGPGAEYNYRIDSRDTIACERIGLLAERFQQLNPTWGFTEVKDAILSYIPVTYQDDLDHLISLLIPLCADLTAADAESTVAAVVEDVADEIGKEQLQELLVQWFVGGYATGGGR